MDVIKRFMLFDKTILVSVISAKELVDKAIKIHSLSRTAAAALGRTLIVGAYMGTELKDDKQKLSITINGGGPLGRIVVLSDYGAKVRGYVENPAVELPLNGKGKLDVGGGVGKNGYISVIKDLGLKEPYSGRCPIVDGEIANDFAYYFTVSEQQPSAVALGVLAADNECVGGRNIRKRASRGGRQRNHGDGRYIDEFHARQRPVQGNDARRYYRQVLFAFRYFLSSRRVSDVRMHVQ